MKTLNLLKLPFVLPIVVLLLIHFAENRVLAQKYSPEIFISVSFSNKPIHEVLDSLSRLTKILFSYDAKLFDPTEKISIDTEKEKLSEVLNQILRNKNLVFKTLSNSVVIYKPAQMKEAGSASNSLKRIAGRIIDLETRAAVPFSTIQIEDYGHGAVAGLSGRFVLLFPERLRDCFVVISCMGYEKKILPLSELGQEENIIPIKQRILKLSTVNVTIPDPYEIVKNVIRRFLENYPTEPYYLASFYRETIKENGKCTKLAESVCRYYMSPQIVFLMDDGPENKKLMRESVHSYFNDMSGNNLGASMMFTRYSGVFSNPLDQVKIQEARSSDNNSVTYSNPTIVGGPLGIIANEFLRFPFLPYSLECKSCSFDEYALEFIENVNHKGRRCYRIAYRPKSRKGKYKSNPAGEMYIDHDTYAIVQLSRKTFYDEQEYKSCRIVRGKCQAIYRSAPYYYAEMEYQLQDSTWYLKSIMDEHIETFRYPDSILNTYKSRREMYVDDVIRQGVTPYKEEEIFKNISSNSLFEYPLSYNEAFWEDYPEAKYPPIDSELLSALESRKKLKDQFRDKHKYSDKLLPPVAEKLAVFNTTHGDSRVDEYSWVEDITSPQTGRYIWQENEYNRNHMVPHRHLQRKLASDMASWMEENDQTYPHKYNGYYYYERYEGDDEYPVHCRKKDGLSASEEIFLDENKLAKGKPYYEVFNISISDNNQLLAYAENLTGGFEATLRFKDLTTGDLLADSLGGCIASVAWSPDSKSVYYTMMDSSYRSNKLYRHILGSDQHEDVLIYTEEDKLFELFLTKSTKLDYIYLNITSLNTTEVRYLDEVSGEFFVIHPRQKGHNYYVKSYDEQFYILTNKDAINNRLMVVGCSTPGISNWKEVIPHRPNVQIISFEVFRNFLVLHEREKAHSSIRIINRSDSSEYTIDFGEEAAYGLGLGWNPDYDSEVVEISYSSLLTPFTIYGYHMINRKKEILWKDKVNELYDPRDYILERLWATADDGKQIPVTLMYKKKIRYIEKEGKIKSKFRFDGKQALYLSAYGAYGAIAGVQFMPEIFSLVDRGYIYAKAHVRGGGELGDEWYQQGKLLNKKNSFTDYVSVAEYLVDKGFTSRGNIIASGGSAGGLLMGVVLNENPGLFKAVILDHPFVDVLNTMLDSTLFGTTEEYLEWGNPNIKQHYDYIKSYSPYDNVKKQDYPNILFMTGINDINVSYWEPVKMVAKLRANKTNNNILLLKTDMYSGHGSQTGRFTRLKDLAFMYAFILSLK